MDDVWGRQERAVEEMVPDSGWCEDQKCHYLLFDLPDFKIEEVTRNFRSDDHIMVSGKRHKSEYSYVYFEQIFKVPGNSDIESISGEFEGNILRLRVPKKVIEEDEPNKDENFEKVFHEASVEKWRDEAEVEPNKDENLDQEGEEFHEASRETRRDDGADLPERASEKLSKKKGIMIIIAVLAFSLGVLVSKKFPSPIKWETLQTSQGQ